MIRLAFNIFLVLFVLVAVCLLNNFLTMIIQAKHYEKGIMRVLGLGNCSHAIVFLVQVCYFTIPAIIFAYFCSYPCLRSLFKLFIGESLDTEANYKPTGRATILAISIGLLIPLISCIIPV